MTDTERLVQRFIDQELSPEERMRFVARLGRDAALRQQVIDFEQLALDVSRLPRPGVPDGFVERVVAEAVPAPPAWRGVVNALLRPRTFHWNLASAGAVACLVLIGLAGLLTRPAVAPDATTATAATSTTAATAPRTVLVRLVVVRPGAATVAVAGDFNGWNPARTPLEPGSNGAWVVTIPLEPGRYEYMFVVNGQEWIADPFAAERTADGFGSENAVLDVRPDAGAV